MSELEPISGSFDARVEPSSLDRRFSVVDPSLAQQLRTEHTRTFEVVTVTTPAGDEQLTPSVPNVGADDLAHLDERGLAREGTVVRPGVLLVGKVTPRGGGVPSSEEKLLRAIFGEAVGEMRDSSLRAPPGCFGVVAHARCEPGPSESAQRAVVEVEWERPLDVGDVLLVDGEPVLVAAIEPLDADLAWSGGAGVVSVAKAAMARDVLHARSIGPYSLVSQQPVHEREDFGGQPLEPAQVEQLAAHAPWALWELLTIKSDSVLGRTRAYESIVRQKNPDVVPRLAAAVEPSSPPTADAEPSPFSFFERPDQTAPGEVPAVLPESATTLVAYLRAMGLELTLRRPAVGITIRSPQQLRDGSSGQVRKPETLNYRTLVPVPDGLFCQRIFGPVADYECACGKYKRMKHRGIVCEECGVEVVGSKVRRERFGHVELPVPCLHPLFAAELAMLLGLDEAEVRAVAGGTRVLREPSGSHGAWRTEPGESTEGRLALWRALESLDLEAIDALEAGPRADLAAALLAADLPATRLMLEVVPVLPPDLRPLVPLRQGFATSDLNDLYRRLLNRSNRLTRLLELEAPVIVVANEADQLQAAVDQLMINGWLEHPVIGSGDRVLRSLAELTDELFEQRLFTKHVDYSGVAHLVADPSLAPEQCRVPQAMLAELFKPQAYGILEARGYVSTIKSAKRMIDSGRPEGMWAIEEASDDALVLLMAGSTVLSRRVQAWEHPAIAVDPSTAEHLRSRSVTLHVPLMHEAMLECVALDEHRSVEPRPPAGWLCRARRAGGFVKIAATAAVHGERDVLDELDDPVVPLALGRPPAAPDPEPLERWAEQERTRRDHVRARIEAREGIADEPASSSSSHNPNLERRVDELELSVSTSEALEQAGLDTLGALCRRTEAELLKTKGFRRRNLKEVKEVLAELGLALGMRDA